jgi:preprotein translocase subunit SecF
MKYLFLILSLLVLIGCTVTKRLHQPGYYIDWKSNSLRSIQVKETTPIKEDITIIAESTNELTTDQPKSETHFSESDSGVLTTQYNNSVEKTAFITKKTVNVSLVKKIVKPIKKMTGQLRTSDNQFVGGTRTLELLRTGLILLLVGAFVLGIGILLIFLVSDDLLALFALLFVIIGAGALIASLLILLFTLLVFLLFG